MATPAHGEGPRLEYYHDADAPRAPSMPPAAFAVVRDARGRLLLVQRRDNGNWELPGGRIDLGESAMAAVVREVAEEAGVDVVIERLAGVYSDPGHLIAYPATGEIRQQFAVCFHARALRGSPRPDGVETGAAAWVEPAAITGLPIHPSMRLRIEHALAEPDRVHYG